MGPLTIPLLRTVPSGMFEIVIRAIFVERIEANLIRVYKED
jgi:hypothetical protein